jgi:hypothetical protein
MPGGFTASELVGGALSMVFFIGTSSIGLSQLTPPSFTKPPVELLRAAIQPADLRISYMWRPANIAWLVLHWPSPRT